MPALGEDQALRLARSHAACGRRESLPGNTHRVDSASGTPVKTASRFRYRGGRGSVDGSPCADRGARSADVKVRTARTALKRRALQSMDLTLPHATVAAGWSPGVGRWAQASWGVLTPTAFRMASK